MQHCTAFLEAHSSICKAAAESYTHTHHKASSFMEHKWRTELKQDKTFFFSFFFFTAEKKKKKPVTRRNAAQRMSDNRQGKGMLT